MNNQWGQNNNNWTGWEAPKAKKQKTATKGKGGKARAPLPPPPAAGVGVFNPGGGGGSGKLPADLWVDTIAQPHQLNTLIEAGDLLAIVTRDPTTLSVRG